jgi:phosphomannomutase
MAYEIKFGTDGWRDVIADGFTFDNVAKVTQACCDVIRKISKNRLVVVGYDNRFFSEEFAQSVARVASSNGLKVELSSKPVSSPLISFHTKARKAAMGFMITASHNPYYFSGFKIKGPHGGSVNESVTKLVEDRLGLSEVQNDGSPWKSMDLVPAYLSHLKKFVSPSVINNLKHSVVFDSMHGPGGDILNEWIGDHSKVVYIRKERDPMFGQVNPEPIETNLQALKNKVLETKAGIGIAVDGDVDRIGLIDEKGTYLPPHTVMPLLLLHLIEDRKMKGKVLQTVSMGYLNKRIAKKYNLAFEEIPVGFKYIAQKMSEEKILLGGEESGGYGCGLWSPERDGLLCALLLIEMLASRKKSLSEIVKQLYQEYGESHFERFDIVLKSPVNKSEWVANLQSYLTDMMGGLKIENINTIDGIKIHLSDDSWVLMRPSGTEPLVRIYSEGSSRSHVEKLIQEARNLVALASAPKKTLIETQKAARRAKQKLKKRK